MSSEAFFHHFPDVAKAETRYVNLVDPGSEGSIPAGSYALMEFYCTDPACDCRRVVLDVLERDRGHVAMISFGFDREEEMAGPFLDPLHPQSPYAEELMDMIEEMTLHDAEYLARLERHYQMVKAKFAPKQRETPRARALKRRQQRRKDKKAT